MFIVTPLTPQAIQWVDDNVQVKDWQRINLGFAVDHHFIEELVDGMIESELIPKTDFDVVHCGG